MLILNIGLKTTHGGTLEPRAAFVAIAGGNPGAVYCGVHSSDTEQTLVIAVDSMTPPRIDWLARHFAQDCIAVWYPRTWRGVLIGPNAAAWGEFNPEYFIMPDGRRLSEQS